MLKRKMIEMLFEKHETANIITLYSLPILLLLGWSIFLFWTIGFGGWWSPIPSLIIITYCLYYLNKYRTFSIIDSRWLIAPIITIIIAWYLPHWNTLSMNLSDGAYHLIEGRIFLNLEVPSSHSGYHTRPPIIPGIFSLEMLITNNYAEIRFMPLLLLSFVLWQAQHLVERWASKFHGIIVVITISLLPVIRYWGQLDYADLTSAGIWIFTLHLLLTIENKNKYWYLLLGASSSAAFLVKYVHIYMLGLTGWIAIKEKNKKLVEFFCYGWLIISAPFILSQITQKFNGTFSQQTSYIVVSLTTNIEQYTAINWYYDLLSQLTLIGIIGVFVGFYFLWRRNRSEFILTCVLLIPLLIIHIIILDWGEVRYHTPWLLLFIIIIVVQPNFEFDLNKDGYSRIYYLLSNIGVIMLILISCIHIGTIYVEHDNVLMENENATVFLEFQLSPLTNLPEDTVLIAGQNMHVSLHTNIPAYRFERSDYPITDAVIYYNPTHVLTTNVNPRFTIEKDFDWQLGHGSIELETIHTDGWWSAALWRVDDTTYLSPDEYYSNYTGNVTGDLLILGPNESFTVGDSNLSIKWIEVTTIRPYQQVMKILAGEEGLMRNGSLDGGEVSFFNSHEQLISPPDKYTYAWIESTK